METWRTILLSFVTAGLLVSCETQLAVDTDSFESQLVINSIFSPSNTWEVSLTHSKSIFDPNTDLVVDNADIMIEDLTSNFEVHLDYQSDKRIYTTSLDPKSGHVYRILIQHPDYPAASAICSVPVIDNIDVASSISDDMTSLNIEVTSKNIEDSDVYYAWEVVVIEDEIKDDDSEISSNDEVIGLLSSTIDYRDSLDVQDNLGNKIYVSGNAVEELGGIRDTINDLSGIIINPETGQTEQSNLYIKVVAVSSHIYEFNEWQNKNLNIQSSSSNPEETYTNVIGGLGLFGGYSEKLVKIQ